VTNNNMVIISHPLYSPDLATVVLLCFPNWKWNWWGDILKQCLTSKGNHKRYSISFRKITSMVLLKHRRNDGITVYIPKETILKEMAAKIEHVKPVFLFYLVPELSNITSYGNLHDGRYLLLISSAWYSCFIFSMTRTKFQP
jgi:hypothetical protein